MISRYINFLQRLLVFSIILGMAAGLLWILLPKKMMTPALPYLFPFFISVTLLSYYFLLKSTGERFLRFVNTYMLLMAARLFIYIILITVYAFSFRMDARQFILSFFILYLCYTVFEVIHVLKAISKPYQPK